MTAKMALAQTKMLKPTPEPLQPPPLTPPAAPPSPGPQQGMPDGGMGQKVPSEPPPGPPPMTPPGPTPPPDPSKTGQSPPALTNVQGGPAPQLTTLNAPPLTPPTTNSVAAPGMARQALATVRTMRANAPAPAPSSMAARARQAVQTARTGQPPTAPPLTPTPQPPPLTAPTLPTAAPNTGTGRIDPNNDLRSMQITTEDDPRTKEFRELGDAATRNLPTNSVARTRELRDETLTGYGDTDVDAGDEISTGPSERQGRYSSMTDDAAGKLAAVDRFELAKQKLKEFRDSTAADYDLDLKRATDLSAAMGQGRSGIQRTRYGDIALDRERLLRGKENELLTSALEGTIGDQFNKASALRGLEEGIAGEERAVRGEKRDDRSFRTNVATGNVERRMGARDRATATGQNLAAGEEDSAYRRLGATRDAESRATSDAMRRADELRGERGYQGGLEEQSFQRRVLQEQMQQAAQRDREERAMRMLQIGEQGNPSEMLAALSESGLDPQIVAQLAASLAGREN